jgi:hypothetical protein
VLLAAGGRAAAAPEPAPPRPPVAPPPWLPQYDLDIRLDVAGHTAQVHERVTWTNCHARPAQEVVFNAHSHYRVPKGEVALLAKTLEILRMNPDEGIYTDRPPLDVHAVTLGGRPLEFRYQGDCATDLEVALPAPVAQGQSVTLDIDFTFHLPQKQGRWGQWEGVTFLSNWLPVVAFYDDHGWQPTPFVPWHQPFFNEAGVYRVRVTLPADQKVACTGTVVATHPLDGGWQEVQIQACGVRDFALLCSARFVEIQAEAANAPGLPPVRVHCLAFPDHEHYARFMVRTVCEVIPTYARWFGPYPYPDFTIVESYFGWNGNECATLVMIDERVFDMPHVGTGYVEYLIAHETCHQWWYNLIGTNGYCETWMDEAMATFFAHQFLDQKHGCNNKMIDYPRGLEWLPNIPRESYRYSGLYGVLGRGEECKIIQPMPEFQHIANLFGMCYDKGGKVVGMIEDRLGAAAFLDFQRRLYDRYAYRILRVADYQRELEEFTGTSWEEFFGRWLHGAGLCDWCVETVDIEPLDGGRHGAGRLGTFLASLHGDGRPQPCQVTVVLHQKAEYDEQTVLGFCLHDDGGDKTPFQVRIPILPQAQVIEHDDPPARVEVLPGHRVRVQVVLPSRPVQIAVDPDNVLVDRDPSNNCWKPRVRWRFTPLYTLLDEADLTTAYDRWNVIVGPWLYGSAYSDPWYTRATMVGLRAGAYRTQDFSGGVYAAYRTSFRDLVAGVDGTWDHWPWAHTQVGFNYEQRLTTFTSGDPHPDRAMVFGRYVFQYNSSLYLPPIHYLEAFATAQDNFLPYPATFAPGAQRYNNMQVAGLHYHLNYLTPYWDPQGGFRFDLTYSGGEVELDRHEGLNELVAEFSVVKGLPDLSGYCGDGCWAGPALQWLSETRLAARLYGAGGLPARGEYFALGGDTLYRGFAMREREGNAVWVGSLEWRMPLARRLTFDAVDHVFGLRNVWGAAFYDVGDAYANGHSFGPVAHALGAGLRLDVTWFGFVERTTLRLDLAKTLNANTPFQFWFGANMPF